MGAAGAWTGHHHISRICMPLFTLGYFLSVPSLRRCFLFFAWIAQGWRTTRRLLAVGLPISMQMVLEVSAFALTLIMMGWIGTVPLAAHQVVLSLSNIVYMVVVGISAATTIMVSHRYGAGRLPGDAPGRTGFPGAWESLRICSR
ncbi:MAG: MATE family efflux transporter [Alistipes indistinctus]